MIINYRFLNNHDFDRDRYYYVKKNLIASAKELEEEITIAEGYSAKNNGFIVSVQVGIKTKESLAFRQFEEILKGMGGKVLSFTLINVNEFRGLIDK